jgi:glucosamine kinase
MKNELFLIADSGSTKADWLILNREAHIIGRFSTIGLNPYFQTEEDTATALRTAQDFREWSRDVTKVRFYGAGCSSPEMNAIIQRGIQRELPNADVTVDHDLTACAYALYRGVPLCATIIGTGSNACFFNGKEMYQEVPSLAYILGDEASGSFLGKKLLAARFYLQLPAEISRAFDAEYGLNKESLLDRVYRQPSPNVFLASFVPFVLKYRENPMFNDWIKGGFRLFLDNHVIRYRDKGIREVGFVGSIAQLFDLELTEVLAEKGLAKGFVIQKPIDRLAEYHKTYGL